MLCSLYNNDIGGEGASALAAVLKETQITKLECAAALECLLLCQPTHSPYPHLVPILRSLGYNSIGPQGAAKLAAVLSQTQITTLECAAPRTRPNAVSAR